MQKDLPEIERTVRVRNNSFLFSVGDKYLSKSGYIVDTGFLQMFSFPMLKEDPSTALNDMHSVVLTEKAARSLFGNEDALGKMVKWELFLYPLRRWRLYSSFTNGVEDNGPLAMLHI